MPSAPTAAPSSEVATALSRWRAAHPAATLAEIEHAADRHLSATRAELIAATAAAGAPDERPTCRACGTPLQRVGRRSRRLSTAHGGEVACIEPAYRCPACRAGVFPPD